jgi:KaiC/GvpD/RAD55 family RecA-like ATPase
MCIRDRYNRTRVRDADTVIVVEGEKCVHALHEAGHVATTSPGGAGKASHADWTPLAGKTVYLWPDNDPPGKDGVSGGVAHMEAVQGILGALTPTPRLFWIDPTATGLPAKGDAADLLEMYDGDLDVVKLAVRDILGDAKAMTASSGVLQIIEDTISGKRKAMDWPWPALTNFSQALLPGTVTVLCGDPGASKSFMLLEAAAHWQAEGHEVAVFELEEDRAYHLRRVLAQLADDSGLTNDDYVRRNPDLSRQAYTAHAETLDALGEAIWDAPTGQVTLDGLAQWVDERCRDGAEIVGIDPVTAAEATDKPWVADLKFLMAVKDSVRRTGARLVLVTHPKKGRKAGIGLDELAGGAAYARFPQTVLWLERISPARQMQVCRKHGEHDFRNEFLEIDRLVRVSKARNGQGAGMKIACRFSKDTLRLNECGYVVEGGAT